MRAFLDFLVSRSVTPDLNSSVAVEASSDLTSSAEDLAFSALPLEIIATTAEDSDVFSSAVASTVLPSITLVAFASSTMRDARGRRFALSTLSAPITDVEIRSLSTVDSLADSTVSVSLTVSVVFSDLTSTLEDSAFSDLAASVAESIFLDFVTTAAARTERPALVVSSASVALASLPSITFAALVSSTMRETRGRRFALSALSAPITDVEIRSLSTVDSLADSTVSVSLTVSVVFSDLTSTLEDSAFSDLAASVAESIFLDFVTTAAARTERPALVVSSASVALASLPSITFAALASSTMRETRGRAAATSALSEPWVDSEIDLLDVAVSFSDSTTDVSLTVFFSVLTVLPADSTTSDLAVSVADSALVASTVLPADSTTSDLAVSVEDSALVASTVLPADSTTSDLAVSVADSALVASTVLPADSTTSDLAVSVADAALVASTVLPADSTTSDLAVSVADVALVASTVLPADSTTSDLAVSVADSALVASTVLPADSTTSDLAVSVVDSALVASTVLPADSTTSDLAVSVVDSALVASTVLPADSTTSDLAVSVADSALVASTVLPADSTSSVLTVSVVVSALAADSTVSVTESVLADLSFLDLNKPNTLVSFLVSLADSATAESISSERIER